MLDPAELISHWGYAAIFLCVLLGSAGVPVPEESVLVAAGYLVWRGELRFPLALAVGIVSAAAGDNLGYWVGRRYGRAAVERFGRRVFITPERLDVMQALVTRWGAPAVFVARFIPGFRAWAGPIAGTAGMPFPPFFVANTLGAAGYVPLAVGAGYAVGYGLGDRLEELRSVIGRAEFWLIGLGLAAAAGLLAWRMLRGARPRRSA